MADALGMLSAALSKCPEQTDTLSAILNWRERLISLIGIVHIELTSLFNTIQCSYHMNPLLCSIESFATWFHPSNILMPIGLLAIHLDHQWLVSSEPLVGHSTTTIKVQFYFPQTSVRAANVHAGLTWIVLVGRD